MGKWKFKSYVKNDFTRLIGKKWLCCKWFRILMGNETFRLTFKMIFEY